MVTGHYAVLLSSLNDRKVGENNVCQHILKIVCVSKVITGIKFDI